MRHKQTAAADDERYMREAIRLSRKGIGRTSPNPAVGAVIVKNNRVIGRGYHQRAGGPHAEINALRNAGKAARGATLYVTLEPCSTHGRTPPCTGAIAAAGIKKVVIGDIDPNPLHAGKGIVILKRKGLKVLSGVLADEARALNRTFNKYITQKTPFVTVKAAMTLDGRLATVTGDSKWITNEASRRYAHRLRKAHDAVLVGVATVRKDDPSLDVRYGIRTARQPYSVVLDSRGTIPPRSRLLQPGRATRTIVVVTGAASRAARKRIEESGARVVLDRAVCGRVDMCDALKKLADLRITSVLVEGGAQVIASVMQARAADALAVFIAPKLVGGADAPALSAGKGIQTVQNAIQLHNVKIKRFGSDILLTGDTLYK